MRPSRYPATATSGPIGEGIARNRSRCSTIPWAVGDCGVVVVDEGQVVISDSAADTAERRLVRASASMGAGGPTCQDACGIEGSLTWRPAETRDADAAQ